MTGEEERVPFRVTHGGAAWDDIERLPVSVLLENLRSAFNVGSFFRTADAVAADKLILCGITSAYSAAWRSAFRVDGDHDSGLMAIGIPGRSRSVFRADGDQKASVPEW